MNAQSKKCPRCITGRDLATKADLKVTQAELRTEIATSKVALLMWMAGFWITQMAAMIFLMLNKK